MKNVFGFILLALGMPALLLFTGCDPQKKIAGNYQHDIECMGNSLDGSEIIKAWGTGKNREVAIDMAEKNALHAVLFNGIIKGTGSCDVKPVVPEVNAEQNYEKYFNSFFADGGKYKSFVSLKNEPRVPLKKKDREVGIKDVEFGVVVTVMRSQLKQQLITDGILKK